MKRDFLDSLICPTTHDIFFMLTQKENLFITINN